MSRGDERGCRRGASIEALNMDFNKLVFVDLETAPWVRSAHGEVDRRPLERAEAESGHATSVVRYAPGAAFPRHEHSGGEEFLVLDGVFSDEFGDYPAGTYVRNPIGSVHAPFSRTGCLLFVKLCQLPSGNRRLVMPRASQQWRPIGSAMSVATLHVDDHERVDRMTVAETARVAVSNTELLILSGALKFGTQVLSAMGWLRVPDGPMIELEISKGTSLWRKRGHLSSMTASREGQAQ